MSAPAEGGASGGTQPAGGTQPNGADWGAMVGTLPEAMRGAPALKNAKSFDDFVGQHLNLEKTLGTQRLPKPQPGWTDKEWNELHTALGNPDKPDGYDFKGIELGEAPETKELLGSFTKVFAEARLSNTQARKLVETWQGMAAAQDKARSEAVAQGLEKVTQELKTEWGTDFDKKMENANKAAQKLFGEKLEDFRQIQMADGSYLGDHPLMLRLLTALEDASVEGQLPGSRGTGALSAENAQSQMNAFMGNPENVAALNSSDHPRHKEAVAERQRLQEVISGQGAKTHYSPIGLG
jgi:hypothetical protein